MNWGRGEGAMDYDLGVEAGLCGGGREAFEGGGGGGGSGHVHGVHHLLENHGSGSTTSSEELLHTTTTSSLQLPNRAWKRKADAVTTSSTSGKVSDGDQKCLKSSHLNAGNEGDSGGSLSPSSLKACSKLQETPKQDFIHVRARRGQATDSHSLAERVRREKISERMKFLQDLVPGCSKVTGKAVMLDEIINYVQSLQRQIEFLSMKLAAVDSQLDINLECHFHKEFTAQARSPETTLMGPDPSIGYQSGYRENESHQQIQQHLNNCNVMDLRSVGNLCDAYLRSSMNNNYAPGQLAPPLHADSFLDPFAQTLNGVYDGDLQNIVHMGNNPASKTEFFGQGRHHGPGFISPGFLKVEY